MTDSAPRPGAETGQVDQDAPFPPDPPSASGLEDAGRVATPGTGVEAARDAHSGLSPLRQVERLAALLEPEAFDPDVPASPEWRERAQNSAVGYAARAIDAGYRRVVVDDTTVEAAAAAMANADGRRWTFPDGRIEPAASSGLTWPIARREHYLAPARAAVRAVLEGPGAADPPRHHHDCCPHCTARKGSCVRCGVRDAVAWELCGQCDREVEAEAAASGRAVLGEDQP